MTLAELMAAVAIGAMVVLVAVPAFQSILTRSRVDTATRQVVTDLRSARSKSIMTGWEYKLMGFGNSSTDLRKNQYRVLARSSSGVAWPADTANPMSSATQYAGAWTNLANLQTGAQLLPGGAGSNARFEIAFDARGSLSSNTGDFNPFQVRVKTETRSITVSVIGGVTTQ
jgi:Tfp pilus assembly protein FimT